MRVVAALASLMLLASCAGDATEIIVVVDTDFAVPDALDAITIRIDASGLGGQEQDRSAELSGDNPVLLPVSLGVVHTGGALEPLRIAAIGRLGPDVVIRRDVEVAFVPGQIRILRIMLERECFEVACAEGQTCEGGDCRSVVVGAGELEPWLGDVGGSDGGFCEPAGETCNERDDDCDGAIDEVFDLQEDPNNCGACGALCPETADNAVRGECIAGVCELLCNDGYFDCNADPSDGCESDLRDLDNCGVCGTSCRFPSATTRCDDGVCALITCDSGSRDCDMVPENGCESMLQENDNCGGCGVPCDLPNSASACGTGTCTIVGCDAGFDDCDMSTINGCEVETATSLRDCGTCGNACPRDPPNASAACTAGACEIICDPGFADCDSNPSNGCEADLNDPTTCGDCTTVCRMGMPLCSGNPTDGWACRISCPGGADLCPGDVCVDLSTNPSNCGTCGNVCPGGSNATTACEAGSCLFACDPGFGDCNGDPTDGCERRVDSLMNCGACGNSCAAAGADVLRCDMGTTCVIDACMPDVADCDGMFGNGCETSLTTLSDCGSCGTTCSRANATPMCGSGVCLTESCDAGYDDCDGADANGCEADLADPTHCGSCANNCPMRPNSTGTCSGGTCGFSCVAPFGDCDSDPVTGCETDTLSDTDHCGACGAECIPGSRVNEVGCTAGSCEVTDCSGDWADCNGEFADGCEVDTDSDDDNCGFCGRRCGGGDRCDNGRCD